MHFDITTKPGGRAIALAMSLQAAEGNRERAAAWISGRGFKHGDAVAAVLRAAVGDSAAPDAVSSVSTDLVEAARPFSVSGKLLRMGMLRNLPLKTRLIGLGVGSTGAFVHEGQALPVSKIDWTVPRILEAGRVGAIIVLPRESFENPAVADAARVDLLGAVGAAEDQAMFDPANVGASGAPQSLTSTGAAIPSSGTTVDAIDEDLKLAVAALVAEGSTLESCVWIASPTAAAHLASLRGTSGATCCPGVSVREGGTLMGLPLIVSQSVAGSIVLLDAAQIAYGDAGAASISLARSATLEMSDAPTGHAIRPTAATAMRVSMFQADAVGVKAIRSVGWLPRRPIVAATITGFQA
jgi:HK97 family phage major capsid protein